MSNFHSTLSRRDFMKGLALAGAGLGAAAAVAPVFHDLDELAASEKTHNQHRWWIKERDYEDITTPVDWSVYQAYDRSLHPMPGFREGGGPMTPERMAERSERHLQGIINKWPGSTLRDLALDGATGGNYGSTSWDGVSATTPEGRGAPGPWEGTPEDNLQTCRAALHFYGSPRVGAIEINEHMKRLFTKGEVVWDDSDVGYRDENRVYHIPNKCRWILVWLTKQNSVMGMYTLRNDPDDPWYNKVFRQGKAGENMAYTHAPQIRYYINKFVKGIGYLTLKPSARANVPFGVFAGITEQGRTSHSCSPDYGCMMRYMDFIVTDLPLAPTKPIDGGVIEFCKSCMLCAKSCPVDALSLDKEPSYEVRDPGNNPGHLCWHMGWTACSNFGSPFDCVNCQTVCPFNHVEDAIIHPIIRAVASTTPIFNGFFATMDKAMGYGMQRSDEEHLDWWYRDLNTWPYDSLLGFGCKGW